jgi:HEAT repeat protein
MGRRSKLIALMIALPAVGGLAFFALRDKRATPAREDGRAARLAAMPETGSASSSNSAAASPDDAAKRAAVAIATWRTGVLVRDADKVVQLEQTFLEAPDLYVEGLKSAAAADENERVRAFATRELGKFKRVELAAIFERLLDDKNAYVRKNAAWGLGELGASAEARHAQPQLRVIARRDPEESVRIAARTALDGIE